MAAINQILDSRDVTLPKGVKEVVLGIVIPLFWDWFDENRDDVITKISLFRGLIKFSVRVRDLRPLFVKLFGEQP